MIECRGAIAAAAGLLLLMQPAVAAPPLREAPNPGAVPFDQLAVAGNACGPAALLNGFRFGDKNWQRALTSVAGDTDKARLLSLIRTWGLRPSKSLAGRKRWGRHGMNADDLCDIANEVGRTQLLPQLQCEGLMIRPGESPPKLLERVRSRLETSLTRGIPPIISVRRIVLRKTAGKAPEWVVLQGHFLTITSVPRKLEKNADSFPIHYLDPWGGHRGEGRLVVSSRAFVSVPGAVAPCLEADLPQVEAGNQQARAGEKTLLTLAAGIGKW